MNLMVMVIMMMMMMTTMAVLMVIVMVVVMLMMWIQTATMLRYVEQHIVVQSRTASKTIVQE